MLQLSAGCDLDTLRPKGRQAESLTKDKLPLKVILICLTKVSLSAFVPLKVCEGRFEREKLDTTLSGDAASIGSA